MASLVAVFLTLAFLLEGVYGLRVMCVYQNWAQYRTDQGRFMPEDVEPTLCTHIIYVYAKLQGNRLVPTEWNDEGNSWSEGMFDRVQSLKQINPELKTLLGVGGWTAGSKEFSRLAGRPGSRRMFALNAVSYLRERHFDGLAIDWQYPTRRGGRPHDRKNFSLLLKELRRAIEEDSKKSGLPSLLLSIGVSASREIIDKAYEIENITRYTDFINVLAYDLHGAWDNYTGHPSQLYARKDEFGPSTEVNVDAVMRYWISNVSDRSKLNLGVSTYGRTFTLRKARHHEYNVPTKGPGLAGDYTKEPGMLAYYERCSQYAGATRVWDDASKVAYWYQGDQWTAGEDVESIKAKVRWVKGHSIGGMALWSLDTDDFFDTCSNGSYPLLNAIQEEKQAPFVPTTRPSTVITDSTTIPSTSSSSATTTTADVISTTTMRPKSPKGNKTKLQKTPNKATKISKKTKKTVTIKRDKKPQAKSKPNNAGRQDKRIIDEPAVNKLSKKPGPGAKGKKHFPSRNENPNNNKKANKKAIRQGNRIIIRRKKVVRKPKNIKTAGNKKPKSKQKHTKGKLDKNIGDKSTKVSDTDRKLTKTNNDLETKATNSDNRNTNKSRTISSNINSNKHTDSVSASVTKAKQNNKPSVVSSEQPKAEPLKGASTDKQQSVVLKKDGKSKDDVNNNGKKAKTVEKKVPAKKQRGRKVIRRKLTKKQIQMLRKRRRQRQQQMKNKNKKTVDNKSV